MVGQEKGALMITNSNQVYFAQVLGLEIQRKTCNGTSARKKQKSLALTHNCGDYNGPQNLDTVISYTWEIKGGGPSGTNAKEVSAFI